MVTATAAACLAEVALAPVALYDASRSFDPAGLPYVVATGLIHAGYFGLLAAGYRRGELSVVYPLARGTGVAGTALVAWAVIGEGISAAGAAGIGSVCLGVLALGLRELRRPLYRPVRASPYSVRPFRTG